MIRTLDPKTVGQNIATLRDRKKIKALDVAKTLGMSDSNYTKYERGDNEITLNFINSVATFLNVNPLLLITSNPDNIVENLHDAKDLISEKSSEQLNPAIIKSLTLQLNEKDNQIKTLLELLKGG